MRFHPLRQTFSTDDGRRPECPWCYTCPVDPLRRADLEHARQTPPAEKLREALEMMDYGLSLKRASLGRAHPEATDEELNQLLEEWILASD